MSEFEFFEPEDKFGAVKATVHRSGRLGFSAGAIKLIDFDTNKFFKIGRKKSESDGDGKDQPLFLIPVSVEDDKTFRVLKAGDYWYLKTKRLLNQLNIDYRNESVIYDIDEVNENGERIFKMTRKKKRSNNT